MNMSLLFPFLQSAFSLAVLTYVGFVGYQNYRVDQFRHKVFVLRDSLFHDAACEKISFDHEAYMLLRLLMNGYIKFAHKLSLWVPLTHFVFDKLRGPIASELPSFEESFNQATASLSAEQKDRLEAYRMELTKLVMSHVLFSLPEAFVITIPLTLASLIYSGFHKLFRPLIRSTGSLMRGFAVPSMNKAAFDLGMKLASDERVLV